MQTKTRRVKKTKMFNKCWNVIEFPFEIKTRTLCYSFFRTGSHKDCWLEVANLAFYKKKITAVFYTQN